jgi:hypothetical protein
MRVRFEQQLKLGQLRIEDLELRKKTRDKVEDLAAALHRLYCTPEYNERLFRILEKYINKGKKRTGRKGMDLWMIFVLAQVRLTLNASYEFVYNLANNHKSIRWVMGVETESGFPRKEFEYQNIYDNLNLLDDKMLKEINELVVEFGHKEVFKKKDTEGLDLKSDSFVVESNVHFPTDYNLLWDSARKILDTVLKIKEKHNLKNWRKIKHWRSEIKGLMRELGKASASGGKNKAERVKLAAKAYLAKSSALLKKVNKELSGFPIHDIGDLNLLMDLEYFIIMLEKHIDLVRRRIIEGETIPHEEKVFSIFETYTEWVKKGKMRPNVEFGKKLTITTDQYNLIVDYYQMEHDQDRDIVITIADRLLIKYKIDSWSFDKGYWRTENKELLQLEIPKVIMPKLGKRNKQEEEEEKSYTFKRLKNKHSAIESNINELEQRGLDRCPDRGIAHYTRYVAMAICAYNLKKIGAEILRKERIKLKQSKLRHRLAA